MLVIPNAHDKRTFSVEGTNFFVKRKLAEFFFAHILGLDDQDKEGIYFLMKKY